MRQMLDRVWPCLAAAALLGHLLTACDGDGRTNDDPGDDFVPTHHDRLNLWWEDSNLQPVEDNLPLLAAHRCEVTLGLHPGEVDVDVLERVVRAAHEHDVPIHLWPLLLPEDGYFPNVRSADAFVPWWNEIVALVEDRDLPVGTFIVDLEPPLQVLHEVQALFSEGLAGSAVSDYLLARWDPEIYAQGTATLKALVDETRAKGFHVHASTLFLVLDDYQDDDRSIQMGFDVPIDEITWDEVSFQVYRSSFNDFLGGLMQPGEVLSPYVVYDYARTAKEQFGEITALDLGLVGQTGYDTPTALHEDVAAAYALGFPVGRLNVYSLMAVLEAADPASWVDLDDVEPAAPAEDVTSMVLRSYIQSLDKQIDL